MPIQAEDIKYLALEGGGGKGLLFPGALIGLMEKGILDYEKVNPSLSFSPLKLRRDRLRGLSGASAGAITALLVSCGYTPTEILMIMEGQNMDAFFDLSAAFPAPLGCRFKRDHVALHDQLYPRTGTTTLDRVAERVLDVVCQVHSIASSEILPVLQEALEDEPQFQGVVNLINMALAFGNTVPSGAIRSIRTNIPQAVYNLVHHYGIFSGCVMREFLHKWHAIACFRNTQIGAQEWHDRFVHWQPLVREEETGHDITEAEIQVRTLKKVLVDFEQRFDSVRSLYSDSSAGVIRSEDEIFHQAFNVNFNDHQDIFGVPFFLTGSNIESRVTEIFSPFTTGPFPVVDGVRISMSLPFIFKPMVIRDASLRIALSRSSHMRQHQFLQGVWADGGYLNNLPLHVFELSPSGRGLFSISEVLGLRLGEPSGSTPPRILNFNDYANRFIETGILGAGESQLSRTLASRAHLIDFEPGQLTTFEFNPPRDQIRSQVEAAHRRTLDRIEGGGASSTFFEPERRQFSAALDAYFR